MKTGSSKLYMYVSSWNEHGGAPGLALYRFDQENGEIEYISRIDQKESFNCSYVDDKNNKLYVNNEVTCFEGAEFSSGRIFVYDLDPQTGAASETARIITECPNPSYINIDPSGRYLFEAHHSFPTLTRIKRHIRKEDGSFETSALCSEASVQIYELGKDGIPVRLVEDIDHNEMYRTTNAHPHSAVFSPSGEILAVADKGTGYLYLYHFDQEQERLLLLDRAVTDNEKGSPRYVVFHSDRPYLFVNHEASYDGKCYVTAFRYEESGKLERICVENVLDQALPVKTGTRLEQQGLVISPDGRYLYSLINAADVIAVVEINQETGKLSVVQNISIPGNRPRGLAMSPNGRFVIATCLVGGEIISFRIGEGGKLTVEHTGVPVPGAAYISFYSPE